MSLMPPVTLLIMIVIRSPRHVLDLLIKHLIKRRQANNYFIRATFLSHYDLFSYFLLVFVCFLLFFIPTFSSLCILHSL